MRIKYVLTIHTEEEPGEPQYWEIRAKGINALGVITSGGWYLIERVVHTDEKWTCKRAMTEAKDVEGYAHAGPCDV